MQAKAVSRQSSVISRQEKLVSCQLSVRRLSRGRLALAAESKASPERSRLRNPYRFGGKRGGDRLCRFTLQARTQQLSFNIQSIQKLGVSWPQFVLN